MDVVVGVEYGSSGGVVCNTDIGRYGGRLIGYEFFTEKSQELVLCYSQGGGRLGLFNGLATTSRLVVVVTVDEPCLTLHQHISDPVILPRRNHPDRTLLIKKSAVSVPRKKLCTRLEIHPRRNFPIFDRIVL